MKESDLELDCRQLAERMGWAVYKGHGRVGAPDKIFLKDGKGFTCEMKKEDGVQRLGQAMEESYLKAHGVSYYLIRNLEEFKEAILKESKCLK